MDANKTFTLTVVAESETVYDPSRKTPMFIDREIKIEARNEDHAAKQCFDKLEEIHRSIDFGEDADHFAESCICSLYYFKKPDEICFVYEWNGMIHTEELREKAAVNINKVDQLSAERGLELLEASKKSTFYLDLWRIECSVGAADINVTDENGKTPMMYAAEFHPEDTINMNALLLANADFLIKDNEGKTAMDYAIAAENFNICSQLKEAISMRERIIESNSKR